MNLKQKCELYFLIYANIAKEHVPNNGKRYSVAEKAMLHKEAFQRTNYCLAAVDQSVTLKEIYEYKSSEAL